MAPVTSSRPENWLPKRPSSEAGSAGSNEPLLPRDIAAGSRSALDYPSEKLAFTKLAATLPLRGLKLRRSAIYILVTLTSAILFLAIPSSAGVHYWESPYHYAGLTSAADILRNAPRFLQPNIREINLPSECTSSDFNDEGYVFHSIYGPSAGHANSWYSGGGYSSKPILRMLESQKSMSQECTDLWISKGQICDAIRKNPGTLKEAEIDFAWTFVEPTNHWMRWKDTYVNGDVQYSLRQGTRNKNFREHNQLMYSVRSVLNLLPFVKKGTLLAASLPSEAPHNLEDLASLEDLVSKEGIPCRATQKPPWLNASMALRNNSRLQLLSHWDLFRSTEVDDLNAWRQEILPTFNSQLVNIPDQSETLVYMNDDFYIGQPVAPSDFASALYGTVYRITPDKWLVGTSDKERLSRYNPENRNKVSEFTVGLVSDRFGKRDRNWLAHVAYTTSVPMMQEVACIWAAELKETAEARFRGRGVETYLPLLSTLYHMERHREALLWSFFMARNDQDGSGTYSISERQAMLETMGGRRSGNQHGFRMPDRPSFYGTYSDRFDEAGVESPRETNFKWSSRDGFLYMASGHRMFPDLDGRPTYFCKMSLQKCFGSADFFERVNEEDEPTSEWLFKNMAYANPKCGDCMLAGLVTASGQEGLEAFLPSRGQLMDKFPITKADGQEEVPYLGDISKTWQDLDISLDTVLTDEWTPRDFAVRLIQRYSYVIGSSSFVFDKFDGSNLRTTRLLNKIMNKSPRPAFIALNDNLPDDTSDLEAAENDEMLRKWHEEMWPESTEFELPHTIV